MLSKINQTYEIFTKEEGKTVDLKTSREFRNSFNYRDVVKEFKKSKRVILKRVIYWQKSWIITAKSEKLKNTRGL